MRKPPNLAISTWARSSAPQLARGDDTPCSFRHDLPWISDLKPGPEHVRQMLSICSGCPVRTMCATYAVETTDRGRGAIGGFYAGVWLPWPTQNEPKLIKHERERARGELRALMILGAV